MSRLGPTNKADLECQRMSQGRNLPTNTRDPPSLINNNELRAPFQNTKYASGTWSVLRTCAACLLDSSLRRRTHALNSRLTQCLGVSRSHAASETGLSKRSSNLGAKKGPAQLSHLLRRRAFRSKNRGRPPSFTTGMCMQMRATWPVSESLAAARATR